MRLVDLNATLACHPFFAEVGRNVPYPPFDRVRLVRVEYDVQDKRFGVIVRELEKGLKIRFRDTGSMNNDGTRLWRVVFPDPFTDGCNEYTHRSIQDSWNRGGLHRYSLKLARRLANDLRAACFNIQDGMLWTPCSYNLCKVREKTKFMNEPYLVYGEEEIVVLTRKSAKSD